MNSLNQPILVVNNGRKEEQLAAIEKERDRRDRLADVCRELFQDQKEGGILEIGCGHGHFLTAYASAHPEQYCVGIDLKTKRLQKSDKKRERCDLDNLHFLKAEGREFIDALEPAVWIDRVFILFPDPWPKRRHHGRRLIQEDFLRALASHAPHGGKVYFRTDHKPYFEWTSKMIERSQDWSLDDIGCWPFEEVTLFQQIFGEHRSLVASRI